MRNILIYFTQNLSSCRYVIACVHAELLQLYPALCDPMGHAPLGSSVHGILQQEYWSGLPCPPPGDPPDPGIQPQCPALAGGFFTTEPPGKQYTTTNGGLRPHNAQSQHLSQRLSLAVPSRAATRGRPRPHRAHSQSRHHKAWKRAAGAPGRCSPSLERRRAKDSGAVRSAK